MSKAARIIRPVTYPELTWQGPASEIIDTCRAAKAAESVQRMGALIHAMCEKLGMPYSPLGTLMHWSLHQWDKAKRPLFVLDGDLAWALTNTEPPMERFELLPEIPVDGMYVVLPPVFDMASSTGIHKVEGLFITANDVAVPPSDYKYLPTPPVPDKDGHVIRRGLTVLGVGEDISPGLVERLDSGKGWMRDDALIFFHLVPGMPLYYNADTVQGTTELTRVVVNLLYLLQHTKEIHPSKDPDTGVAPGGDRKARREQEREAKKGRSHIPHTVWKLSTMERKASTKSVKVDGEDTVKRSVKGGIVLGHIHHYWVVDPKDKKVVATKVEATKTHGDRTYYKVAKWLLPYMRGEGGTQEPRTVSIR